MKTPQDIASLITRRMLGKELEPEEEKQLDEWLEESSENRETYKLIEETDLAEQILQLEKENYGQRMAARFEKAIHSQERYRFWKHTFGIVAAAACVLAGVFFFMVPDTEVEKQAMQENMPVNLIQPGKTTATLTLADGRKFDLQTTDKDTIHALVNSLAQARPTESTKETNFHTLNVPAGGEYQYVLPDGTKVWLNSQTSLRFPDTFSGETRQVYLEGEAFFDVVSDAGHPFIVTTDKGNIQVYGTRFNITDYADTPFSAVLVSGKISFYTPQGESVNLLPSQRVTYSPENGEINVHEVDTSLYTAWVNHQFVFKGETLEEIMTVLSRWYDFTPVFKSDAARRIKLSGRLNRHEDIRVLLQSYEATTDIKFQIDERNIIITQ